MFFRIIICLSLFTLTSCSTARMAVKPGLEENSVKHQITTMPGVFSGDELVFEPYKATKIDRSWISSEGSGFSVGGLSMGSKDTEQSYSYEFKGASAWNGDCMVEKESSSFGIISGGFSANLTCNFTPIDKANSSWQFSFKGETSSRSTGIINTGSKKITVKATNKMEGSMLTLGQNTGYYFYLGDKIVAAVDAVSKEGPVWLNNKLSKKEKDMIAMAVVALLLNQTGE